MSTSNFDQMPHQIPIAMHAPKSGFITFMAEFVIEEGVYLEHSAFGATFSWSKRGYTVSVKVPDISQRDCWFLASTATGSFIATKIFVTVEVVLNEVVPDYMLNEGTRQSKTPEESAVIFFNKAAEIGHTVSRSALSDWLSHLKCSGQYWLGPATRIPEPKSTYKISVNGLGMDWTHRVISAPPPRIEAKPLSLAKLHEIHGDLITDESPDTYKSLLHDALFFISPTNDFDLNRSVMSAVTACEILIKEKLTMLAEGGDGESTVRYLLKKTSSTEDLLHHTCWLVTKRSLKDESPELWKALHDLVRARNDVAHEGKVRDVDASQAISAVYKAPSIIRWIEDLTSSS